MILLALASVLALAACSESSAPASGEQDTGSSDADEDVSALDTPPLETDGSIMAGTPCQTDADCAGALVADVCQMAVCDPDDNVCVLSNGPNALPCDDGNACTTDTVCFQGQCGGIAEVEGPPGSLGTPCVDNGDCDSGFCVAVSPDKAICTETCLESCPKGFVCRSVLNLFQDVVFVCSPVGGLGMALSCDDGNPCTDDACDPAEGCQHASNTAFCDDANPCTDGDVCMGGSCTGTPTAACDCATNADCAAIDDDNLCNGSLRCVEGACLIDPATVIQCPDPGPCRVATCAPFTGQCVNKEALDGSLCTDGNPCSQPDVCQAGACAPGGDICGACATDADCAPFDDGNPCNGTVACTGGTCSIAEGSVIACSGAATCEVAVCEPASGHCISTTAPNGAPCTDGEACTVGDVCQAGQCQPGNDACEGCLGQAEGTPCDDADPCTLGDACQGGLCVPKQTIDCADEDPCTDDLCFPDGSCDHVGSADGTPCEDGVFCTGGDACIGGICTSGSAPACDDGNVCTNDSCSEAAGCTFAAANAGAACNDGNPCTSGDACTEGACVATGLSQCGDGDPCTADTCSLTAGCQYAPLSGPACDDGNPCTSGDTCKSGVCAATGATPCDDGNLCTDDACSPAVGCTHSHNQAPCTDGLFCTANDTCSGGECIPGPNLCTCMADADCAAKEDACSGELVCTEQGGISVCVPLTGTAVSCADDGNPCTIETCNPVAGGCTQVALPDGAACEDGNPCTLGGACQSGACASGGTLTCDDANPCTVDVCTGEGGCVFSAAPGPCDDGNACTVGDSCISGSCLPGAAPGCDDGNACTQDECEPAAGCSHAPLEAPCDDGDPCTAGDACAGGSCAPGANVCGCQNDGDCAALDDGNVCNGVLVCDTSVAVPVCVPAPGSIPDCSASATTACETSFCNPNTGACETVTADDGTSCDDGNPCSTLDSCLGGGCVGAFAVICDDGNPCTDDECTEAGGCIFAPNTASCSDGNPCTVGDTCQNGACVSGSNGCGCQQDAECTIYEDGNMCNGTLMCDKTQGPGVCAVDPTSVVACAVVPEAGGCIENACNPQTGQCEFVQAPNGLPCNDGNPCTGADICVSGSCQGGNNLGCNDDNPCTNDVCNPLTGCEHKAIGSPCDDGDFCTVGDKCIAGICSPGKKKCDCKKTSHCKKYDDGNLCNGTLTCMPLETDGKGKIKEGQCAIVPGSVIDCGGPANAGCILPTCAPTTGTCGQENAPAGTVCNDGDVCTVAEVCAGGACIAGAELTCGDANPCTSNACDPVLGCTTAPANGVCDDGLSCTAGDHCDGGVCVVSLNECACASDGDCAAFDDGNGCTGKLFCGALGLCQLEPGTLPNCTVLPPPSACESWACSELLGQCGPVPVPDQTPCNDGSACTWGDRCKGGACTSSGLVDCDDGNPCTDDACNPFVGCTHTPHAGKCDDLNPCTLGDKCVGGQCVFKNVKNKCP